MTEDKWWRKYTKEYQNEDVSEKKVGKRTSGQEGKKKTTPPRTHAPTAPRKEIRSFSDQNQDMFGGMGDLTKEMNKIVKGMLGSGMFSNDFSRDPAMPRLMKMEGHMFRKPISEIQQTPDKVIATVELPGVKKDDIKIRIEGQNLIVEAQNREGKEDRKFGFFSFSQSYTGFRHIIRLPVPVEKTSSSAHFEAGILRVSLKKKKSDEAGDLPIE